MKEPPIPEFKHDVQTLLAFFEEAQQQTEQLLLTIATDDDFNHMRLLTVQKQYDAIIKKLQTAGIEWATPALSQSALEGVAEASYSLGLAPTYAEALAVASFSAVNEAMLAAKIADTQKDILTLTQNMERSTKAAIQQAYSTKLREQLMSGSNSYRQLKGNVTRELTKTLDAAIIDNAGRTWKTKDYVDMLVQTKMMHAHREASRNKALEEGTQYAKITMHGAKDACARWEGKIVKLDPDAPGDYPYIDDIPRRQLFHNRCKHRALPIHILEEEGEI